MAGIRIAIVFAALLASQAEAQEKPQRWILGHLSGDVVYLYPLSGESQTGAERTIPVLAVSRSRYSSNGLSLDYFVEQRTISCANHWNRKTSVEFYTVNPTSLTKSISFPGDSWAPGEESLGIAVCGKGSRSARGFDGTPSQVVAALRQAWPN